MSPALAAMHWVGQFFPRSDRSPAIVPVEPIKLMDSIEAEQVLSGWRSARTQRVSRGFYISQALEVAKS